MSSFDIATLSATLIAIVFLGVWKTRHDRKLDEFLKGHSNRWGTIGLSVMATQASAITFLSTPGLAYDSGMAFVQNYFGMPLALVLIAVVFVPMYYRLDLCSVYEFLEHRFDAKTRNLGQRNLFDTAWVLGRDYDLCALYHFDQRSGLGHECDGCRSRSLGHSLYGHGWFTRG